MCVGRLWGASHHDVSAREGCVVYACNMISILTDVYVTLSINYTHRMYVSLHSMLPTIHTPIDTGPLYLLHHAFKQQLRISCGSIVLYKRKYCM
jgi:hypothetical protein